MAAAAAEEEAVEEVADMVVEITITTITTMEEAEGADDALKTIFNSLLRLPDEANTNNIFCANIADLSVMSSENSFNHGHFRIMFMKNRADCW